VPDPYLSVLALDLEKVTASIGAGYHLGKHWRFDAVYAHIFGFSTTVDANEAAVPRINPVKGNATPPQAVNGGDYSARADLIGIGGEYRF
jgi:long-chain fatty acid transport protein